MCTPVLQNVTFVKSYKNETRNTGPTKTTTQTQTAAATGSQRVDVGLAVQQSHGVKCGGLPVAPWRLLGVDRLRQIGERAGGDDEESRTAIG